MPRGTVFAKRPVHTAIVLVRGLFVAIAMISVVLGYGGLSDVAARYPHLGWSSWDILYQEMQMFTLNFNPVVFGRQVPAALQAARFLAPTATTYALVEAGRLLFADNVRQLRCRLCRGHTVVCSTDTMAIALAERLIGRGSRVVMIGPEEPEGLGPNILWVRGDPREQATLRTAGLVRARKIFACAPDSAVNAAIAMAARDFSAGRRQPLIAYARMMDPTLANALRARRLGLSSTSDFRLDFFDLEGLGARVLLERAPVRAIAGAAPTSVVIMGFGRFGQALLVELARQWRMHTSGHEPPLRVTVVDPRACPRLREVMGRYPLVADFCSCTAHDGTTDGIDLDLVLRDSGGDYSGHVYVCDEGEEQALISALRIARLLGGAPRTVTACLDHSAVFADAFGGDTRIFDDLFGSLKIFSLTEEAAMPELIENDVTEQIARGLHEHYVRSRYGRGESSQVNSSLVPWRNLPETLRNSNRGQAQDIGEKLTVIGCSIAPGIRAGSDFEFDEDEVEVLARLEHVRWVRERSAAGVSAGPATGGRSHPDLVAWEQLPESSKEKDRDFVLALPDILADAGWQIIRVVT
jgi:voltage-gated potassium channel Kch